ncbi:helix-turn-helix domain-containing protein [Geoglobus acetivorans]|uniref:TrmB family transcriptional regulator n=1 Tax=Geoglobus acetivorans TaxID=565033 RepID=A0ABZ3H6F2_GEOAI|nr:TrmB family transcriptional regulator [Geoglobus acetivorans]
MRTIKDSITSLNCETILECFYGINDSDAQIYRLLIERNLKIEEISQILGRGENSVYKSLQKLLIAGLVVREKKVLPGGGYYYTYRSVSPNKLAEEMRRIMKEWCEKVAFTINEFEEKFGGD